MQITITPEMLQQARQKLERERALQNATINEDPGAEGICLGCE